MFCLHDSVIATITPFIIDVVCIIMRKLFFLHQRIQFIICELKNIALDKIPWYWFYPSSPNYYVFYLWEREIKIKRELNFRGEGISNRKAESYKDYHFTGTYIQFCTLIVMAGFWVRYFDGAISLSLSLCVGLKLKKPCKEYNRTIYKEKISCWSHKLQFI